ncbi:Ger(x)C family spore germination C-terminal domain-containing protein [Lysinibacillus sp. UGB7]|uniref:Ger(x)C family spore germination C-terminal domain-containing protein n=1 Tax=Lysinibacillus sp. UGB7 TaxID=3411039 RepID=UPI003B7C4560
MLIGLNEPNHEVSIPYVTIKKEWETIDEVPEETAFEGVGVLSKDGFKGFIKDSTTRGIQWMHNETNRGEITFKLDGNERDYLTVDLDKIKVHVKPIVEGNDQVKFEIEIKVNATINGFKGKISSDEIRKNVIKQVKKEVKETYEEGLKLDVDIYRLSEYLYRNNVKAWKKIENEGKIPLTEDSINKITIHVDKITIHVDKITIHVDKINPGRKTFSETIEE